MGSFEGDPVVSEESLTDVETSHRRTKATSTTSQTQTRKVQEAISRHQSKPSSVSVTLPKNSLGSSTFCKGPRISNV